MKDIVYTISAGESADVIDDLLRICFPDAKTILDTTYGKGNFWTITSTLKNRKLTRMDKNAGLPNIEVVADFTKMPEIRDNSYDLVVFDPPYQTDVGKRKKSVMHNQFGSFKDIPTLKRAVEAGVKECFRVSRLGIICKVQDYKHGNKAIWMSNWLQNALQMEPYDFIMLYRPKNLTDPKWDRQLSIWTNHTTFWVFRKDGPIHKSR